MTTRTTCPACDKPAAKTPLHCINARCKWRMCPCGTVWDERTGTSYAFPATPKK